MEGGTCSAPSEKYDSHTKESIFECHEMLFKMKVEPDRIPDNFYFSLDKCCVRFKDIVLMVHDERYKDIIPRVFWYEYE